MSEITSAAYRGSSPQPPPLGALLVDKNDRPGEFRGAWAGRWALRPVTGGREWEVAPEDTRPAGPEERLRAETARANARTRAGARLREETRPPTRRTFRFTEWTLRPDQDEDAPPTTYALRCQTLTGQDAECGQRSARSTDPTEPQSWAFDHLRAYPEHSSYAEVIERPWVMWRGKPA